MKYNDENLDSSMIETSPEPKQSSFSLGKYLAALALFVVVCLVLSFAIYCEWDLSTSSYIEYNMSLKEIVFIYNGFDIEILIYPASILITWALIKLKFLKLIRMLFNITSSYPFSSGELELLSYLPIIAFLLIGSIFNGIVATCYVGSLKKKNAENASEPYVMNVNLKHYPTFHLKGRVASVKIFENSYSYDEYFSSLQNTQNKKISLVVRDGSRGLPVIDAYKIIYNSDESVELDMPTTVEEFYKKF